MEGQSTNLRVDNCQGVVGVRINKNQLLFKGIIVQASINVFDKIYSLDDYLLEYRIISCPKLLLNF